ncbi:MAG: lytic transglycosylase domain-containing protein [Burkholderiaceae bacterium]|nr:lytic transglycosylase domain-containing protein [Burkholderiaceae bacterium]
MNTVARACARAAGTFTRDVGMGMLEVSHNSLAMVGLAVVVGALAFSTVRPDLRAGAERHALDWLLARQEARETAQGALPKDPAAPDAVTRATAADPSQLPRQQASVAGWLARRYRVAPEPISRLVQEAWTVGVRVGLDPTLILAIMAIESSFNPFAQSPVGAQGLMQVMTRVHDEKYEPYGGIHAAFDPVTNLRVGVQVLKECIARAGSLEDGLKYYVGAANLADDGGYVAKVLAEQGHLRKVAEGKVVAVNAPLPVPVPAVAPSRPMSTIQEPVQPPASQAPQTPEDDKTEERVALLRSR